MKPYAYESRLAPYIGGLIQQKRADGYRYELEAYMLHHFDQFCCGQGEDPGGLTRDLVMAWAQQRPTESKNYRNQRVSCVRQLALYMLSLNCNAYVPPGFASNAVTVPHILSPDELQAFYQAVDHFHPRQARFQRCAASYNVLFRLFYCCGLRLSEGCYLRRGQLFIDQSKGQKDRTVFLSEDVRRLCQRYDQLMQHWVPDREWFFPGRDAAQPFSKTSIDKKFAEFWNSPPMRPGSTPPPTVHALRHTYVVTKMNEWMSAGRNFDALVPYLIR